MIAPPPRVLAQLQAHIAHGITNRGMKLSPFYRTVPDVFVKTKSRICPQNVSKIKVSMTRLPVSALAVGAGRRSTERAWR